MLSRVKVSATDAGSVTLAVVQGDQERTAIVSDDFSTLELTETPEPLPPLLVRVTTRSAAVFLVFATRISREPDPVKHPPCDRDTIDPANPNCAGVSPRCDLDKPDFENPDCCQADCIFGRLSCRAKVVSGGATAMTVAIGKNKRIMRFATGRLFQKGKPVSDVLVLQVEAEQSFVQILSPKQVDVPNLVANGEVVLSPPAECRRP